LINVSAVIDGKSSPVALAAAMAGSGSSIYGGDGNDTISVSAYNRYAAIAMTNGNSGIYGDAGDDMITVSGVSSSVPMMGFAMGNYDNTIDGGEGSDLIRIIGKIVPRSEEASNTIRGGEDIDGEDWDVLQIDQNNMQDIVALAATTDDNGQGDISGFEELLLDMTGAANLTLTADQISGLAKINNPNSDTETNALIVKVADSNAGDTLVAQVEGMGFTTATPLHTTPYHTVDDGEALYIQILTNTG
jgi:hypothetical protein